MEFLCADYGSDDEEVRGIDSSSSGQQEHRDSPLPSSQQLAVFSKGDKVLYMNTEECTVVDKHMVNLL